MPSCFARLISVPRVLMIPSAPVSRRIASTAISRLEYPSMRSMWMTHSLPLAWTRRCQLADVEHVAHEQKHHAAVGCQREGEFLLVSRAATTGLLCNCSYSCFAVPSNDAALFYLEVVLA